MDNGGGRRGRLLLYLAALLFLLFCLNVLLGKAQIVFGFTLGLHLQDVSEFLLLLFSALCFTLATLAREKSADSKDRDSA